MAMNGWRHDSADIDNNPRQSQVPFYWRGVHLQLQKGRLNHTVENNYDTAGLKESRKQKNGLNLISLLNSSAKLS